MKRRDIKDGLVALGVIVVLAILLIAIGEGVTTILEAIEAILPGFPSSETISK